MSESELQDMLRQVKMLNPDQRRRLREELDNAAAAPAGPTAEEQFEQLLLRDGLVEALPRPASPASAGWQPVRIQGKPLSQTIIEER